MLDPREVLQRWRQLIVVDALDGAADSTLESMLAPALPEIQRSVGASTTAIAWVFTGLLHAGAVATPLVGRLADVHDKRTVLLGVLGVVAIGTLLAALASNVAMLTAGQVLAGGRHQPGGAGGGDHPPHPAHDSHRLEQWARHRDRHARHSARIRGGRAAPGRPSYTWLYWIPFAVIMASLVAACVFVPSCPPTVHGRVDWVGAGLLGTGLALLLIAISQIAALGWTSPVVLLLACAGTWVLAVFAWWELRTADPLVDLQLLGERTVVLTCAVSFTVGFGTFAVFVLVPMLVGAPAQTE